MTTHPVELEMYYSLLRSRSGTRKQRVTRGHAAVTRFCGRREAIGLCSANHAPLPLLDLLVGCVLHPGSVPLAGAGASSSTSGSTHKAWCITRDQPHPGAEKVSARRRADLSRRRSWASSAGALGSGGRRPKPTATLPTQAAPSPRPAPEQTFTGGTRCRCHRRWQPIPSCSRAIDLRSCWTARRCSGQTPTATQFTLSDRRARRPHARGDRDAMPPRGASASPPSRHLQRACARVCCRRSTSQPHSAAPPRRAARR